MQRRPERHVHDGPLQVGHASSTSSRSATTSSPTSATSSATSRAASLTTRSSCRTRTTSCRRQTASSARPGPARARGQVPWQSFRLARDARRELRLHHRRRRLGRLRARQPPERRSVEPRARARGRPDGLRWDVFIHMPAALSLPIGSRFYDWKYESEPEPYMNGRRIYHARGKVLGGSSSINGMIFQRGNPLDLERWAHDPGMETWAYAHCLPYFKRMETCLAGADEYRGGDGPLVLERGPATNPLFGAFFEAVQQAGYALTVGRQRLPPGGLRAVRPQHPPRPAAERRAGLPAPGDGAAEPRRSRRRAHVTRRALRGHARGRRRVPRTARGAVKRARAAPRSSCCGGSINSPQVLELSGVGNAEDARRCSASPSCTTCPASARTCRTTSRCTSSTPRTQPVSVAPALLYRNRPRVFLEWLRAAQRPGRDEPLRGRRLRALQRRRRSTRT